MLRPSFPSHSFELTNRSWTPQSKHLFWKTVFPLQISFFQSRFPTACFGKRPVKSKCFLKNGLSTPNSHQAVLKETVFHSNSQLSVLQNDFSTPNSQPLVVKNGLSNPNSQLSVFGNVFSNLNSQLWFANRFFPVQMPNCLVVALSSTPASGSELIFGQSLNPPPRSPAWPLWPSLSEWFQQRPQASVMRAAFQTQIPPKMLPTLKTFVRNQMLSRQWPFL